MNTIKKQKIMLIGLAIGLLVLGIGCAVLGILLLVKGIATAGDVSGILRIVLSCLVLILFCLLVFIGVRWLWVGIALKATEGSIKEGNIAKEGGTVNIKKCGKCGTVLMDNEKVCPNCGKKFE